MLALFSIKPEFALKFFSGEKFYEYRRAIFAQPLVERIVVYASSPVMRIVGELEVGEVLEGSPKSIWSDTADKGGVDRSLFFDYFHKRPTAYAIAVKRALTYRIPVDPKVCFSGFRPPQSFQYLDDAELNIIRTAAFGFTRRKSPARLQAGMNALSVAKIQRAIA